MKHKDIIILSTLIIASTALIVVFLPREDTFKYQFQEGKPWKYDLLTATFDFPIYKLENEFIRERDSVLNTLQPYFRWKPDVADAQKQLFANQYSAQSQRIPSAYFDYVHGQLERIYASGIIASDRYNELESKNIKTIKIITDHVNSREYAVDKLYTARSAYEKIFDNAPFLLDKGTLQNLDINLYLTENVEYDSVMTEEVKEQLLRTISNSTGLIQQGQRIIDRGQVVDSNTYKILYSMKLSYEKRMTASDSEQNWRLIGHVLLISCLMGLFLAYLILFRTEIYARKRSIIFLFLIVTGFSIVPAAQLEAKYVYLIPFTILSIIIRIFFDSRTAMMAYITTILINSLSIPFSYEFVIIQLFAGITSVYSLKDLMQRSQIFGSAVFIFVTYSLIYTSYTIYLEGIWSKINGQTFLYFAINALLVLFTYPLVYLFEKMFGFISSVTLVELSNVNHPVLRKLSEEAPGTFQHSLQVSNLATEAATKIGANVQLVRTGALYHDIGKINNPMFFTENQVAGVNPHNGLPFEKSAEIIIKHITDGIKLAEKLHLPQQIADFISTHHGRGKAKYFYNSFKNSYPDREIDEELFTYPGPNPFSRETALLMMADSVEAASRSLTVYDDETIPTLVNRIIDGQIDDGLLKNAPLSFKEIETVKQIFIQKLKTIYHTRISYPPLEGQLAKETSNV
ncbi:MAG: HDIG domain-containing protein [Bacteroidales bacterium]|nr:HDIG domain-containing protein [Bacteroidales bacterium]